jgi:hypothetical protein
MVSYLLEFSFLLVGFPPPHIFQGKYLEDFPNKPFIVYHWLILFTGDGSIVRDVHFGSGKDAKPSWFY